MKIMLDLTVLLDVFQERFPHYPASAAVISRILHKEVSGILPSHALTTIHYLVAKYSGRQRADESIDWMLTHFEIAAADRAAFRRARSLPMQGFEDAVVASLAEAAGCDHIITRNIADFNGSPVPALTPEAFFNRPTVEA